MKSAVVQQYIIDNIIQGDRLNYEGEVMVSLTLN